MKDKKSKVIYFRIITHNGIPNILTAGTRLF